MALYLCNQDLPTAVRYCKGLLHALQAGTFFQTPFRPIMHSKQLREYVVLDIEATGSSTSRNALADVQVHVYAWHSSLLCR